MSVTLMPKDDVYKHVIKFQPTTLSHGRNGYFKTSGYTVYKSTNSNEVELNAITSKGDISNSARINIPEEAWVGTALDKVLDALQKRKDLPAFIGLSPLLDQMIERRLKGS
jgi:hypothetical protein